MKGRSDETERALFLSPEAPFPMAGGGAMRSAALLHYVADRFETDVLAFAVDGVADPRDAIPAGLVRRADTIRLPYHRRDGVTRICRNSSRMLRGRLPLMDRFSTPEAMAAARTALGGRRYRLAVIEHFWCADYLPLLRAIADLVVLDLHNVESALHGSCAETEPWPQNIGHRYFHRRAEQLERRLLPQFDLVLAASDADAARVRTLSPGARVAVFPNALPLRPAPSELEQEVVAFSGNMEYHPNVSAVRFFATQVWQTLREKQQGLVWRLIGKNPHAVQDIVGDDPRIELTGAVDDALPELAKAKIVVAPLLSGSGTRVKIMEAWAAARPVISSPIGAEGLPFVEDENIVLAQTQRQWIEKVLKLLGSEPERRRLGAAGRVVFERELCWPVAWDRLDRVLPSLLTGGRKALAI